MHRHHCTDCGEFYTCRGNPDQCPKHWTCPDCEMQQMDDYWRANPPQAAFDFALKAGQTPEDREDF